jgi:hypothetical protein
MSDGQSSFDRERQAGEAVSDLMGEDTENPSAAALSGDQRQLYPNRRAQPLQRLGDGQRVELERRTAKTLVAPINGGQND